MVPCFGIFIDDFLVMGVDGACHIFGTSVTYLHDISIKVGLIPSKRTFFIYLMIALQT